MDNIYIIGSGMIGVSCALNLLEKKYKVTLIERNDDTKETSFGNAGVIARSSALLINNKNLIPNLKSYLFNTHPAVRLSYPYVMRNCYWAVEFLRQSLKEKSEKNIEGLDSLIRVSLPEHKKWIDRSKQSARLRETGWLKLYRTETSMCSNGYEKAIYDQFNINYESIDQDELMALEPALSPIYKGALYIKDAASVDNPGELVEAYKRLFVELGGKIVYDEVRQIIESSEKEETHAVKIKGKESDYSADQVVIAAGPWSNDLLKSFSKPLPMGFERGYHEHYEIPKEASVKLSRPIYDVEAAFVITPTTLGYRLTSGSEIKDKDAQPSPTQLMLVRDAAKEALALGKLTEKPIWKGNRPTLPDSLPAIGRSPTNDKVWLAFGHQHIGFSTGPATGRLIAELINNEAPFIDPSPFDPARFG